MNDEKNPQLSEGDIFYTIIENESDKQNVFYIQKLLKDDDEFDTYHVLSYKPIAQLPTARDLESLEILAYHSPIARDGFENPQVIAHSKVSAADLIGYHEYLRQTASSEEIVSTAQNYYLNGNDLADERRFEESIDEYSKAAELIPVFYEAIENRAFSKMDLGRFGEAIKDFEMSLEVFPQSLSAIFSIGDCYLRMGKIKNAEVFFAKALEIDAQDALANKFLKHLTEWRKSGMKDEETPETVTAFLNYVAKN